MLGGWGGFNINLGGWGLREFRSMEAGSFKVFRLSLWDVILGVST